MLVAISPNFLHETECCAMGKQQETKVHVARMGMLRWICGVTRMELENSIYEKIYWWSQ